MGTCQINAGTNEYINYLGSSFGEPQLVSYTAREGDKIVINEYVVDRLVPVPKLQTKETLIEKTIVVPQVRVIEEYVDIPYKVREKIVEVTKPIIQETVIEQPEREIRETLIILPHQTGFVQPDIQAYQAPNPDYSQYPQFNSNPYPVKDPRCLISAENYNAETTPQSYWAPRVLEKAVVGSTLRNPNRGPPPPPPLGLPPKHGQSEKNEVATRYVEPLNLYSEEFAYQSLPIRPPVETRFESHLIESPYVQQVNEWPVTHEAAQADEETEPAFVHRPEMTSSHEVPRVVLSPECVRAAPPAAEGPNRQFIRSGAEAAAEFTVPKIKTVYKKHYIPIHVPRFVETAVAAEQCDESLLEAAANCDQGMLDSLASLGGTDCSTKAPGTAAPTLSELDQCWSRMSDLNFDFDSLKQTAAENIIHWWNTGQLLIDSASIASVCAGVDSAGEGFFETVSVVRKRSTPPSLLHEASTSSENDEEEDEEERYYEDEVTPLSDEGGLIQ